MENFTPKCPIGGEKSRKTTVLSDNEAHVRGGGQWRLSQSPCITFFSIFPLVHNLLLLGRSSGGKMKKFQRSSRGKRKKRIISYISVQKGKKFPLITMTNSIPFCSRTRTKFLPFPFRSRLKEQKGSN